MVRKQLYISEEHEKALKARAREMGVSEAELVRGLLDRLLLSEAPGSVLPFGRGEAALEFLESADRISGSHSFPKGYRFDREELYEESRGRGRRLDA
ncbi:MAG: hypothetical protein WA982_04325 [Rubrobacteraceae bacterium]